MIRTILDKLQALREDYKAFPERRKSIELQARVLQAALRIEQQDAFEHSINTALRGSHLVNGFEVPTEMG